MKHPLLCSLALLTCLGCSEQSHRPAQAPVPLTSAPAQENSLRKEYEAVRVKQQGQAADAAYQAEMLGKLSAQGLKELRAGQSVVYFSHPAVNQYFLGRLRARAGEWQRLHTQQLRQQAAANRQERAEDAAYQARMAREGRQQRVSYAKTIRNDFLDNNLDIKATTSGPNAARLTLEYALFSAVWTRKLEVGGGLAGHTVSEWREQGFTKVTLTDGYDYSASFTF